MGARRQQVLTVFEKGRAGYKVAVENLAVLLAYHVVALWCFEDVPPGNHAKVTQNSPSISPALLPDTIGVAKA